MSGSDEELLSALPSWIAELTPDIVIETELVPGEIRLLGCDVPDVGLANLRQAAHFGLTLYFECLPDVPRRFEREVLVNLGDLYVAREPILIEGEQPGAVVKRAVRAYVPRNALPGKDEVSVGIVREGAGGAGPTGLCAQTVPLFKAAVIQAGPPSDISDAEKRALLRQARIRGGASNLITGGGFESGSSGWVFPKKIFWKHSMAVAIDRTTALEGSASLRVDFSGGGDPNFHEMRQSVRVKPGTRHQLSYFIKTENISSNSGTGMCVSDRISAPWKLYVSTPKELRLTGTHPWTFVAFEFETGADMTDVILQVRRFGSGPRPYNRKKFGAIGGSAWYDMIRIVELGPVQG
jgi:hypothetical protein